VLHLDQPPEKSARQALSERSTWPRAFSPRARDPRDPRRGCIGAEPTLDRDWMNSRATPTERRSGRLREPSALLPSYVSGLIEMWLGENRQERGSGPCAGDTKTRAANKKRPKLSRVMGRPNSPPPKSAHMQSTVSPTACKFHLRANGVARMGHMPSTREKSRNLHVVLRHQV
jgi:hypothetical protein